MWGMRKWKLQTQSLTGKGLAPRNSLGDLVCHARSDDEGLADFARPLSSCHGIRARSARPLLEPREPRYPRVPGQHLRSACATRDSPLGTRRTHVGGTTPHTDPEGRSEPDVP